MQAGEATIGSVVRRVLHAGCDVLGKACDRISSDWTREIGKGLDGGMDAFIVTDILFVLRVAYLAPDKPAESTRMTLRMFAGSRKLHKLSADRSGQIGKSLKRL